MSERKKSGWPSQSPSNKNWIEGIDYFKTSSNSWWKRSFNLKIFNQTIQ